MITCRSEPFGAPHGRPEIELFTLADSNGREVAITNYGGIVVSIKTPDRQGQVDDVVLGFDDLSGYLGEHPYFGAIIGRYGNRIAHGRFRLGGVEYQLATNNGPNHLHGGVRGFDRVVWTAREIDGGHGLELTHVSDDGDEGYPGTLSATVRYSLSDIGELRIEYAATADAPTIVNLTNHSYFNLRGVRSDETNDVLDHELTLQANHFTPVDATLIPTGEIEPVDGTPFDFRTPVAIGVHIDDDDEQLRFAGGYDHNWVLDDSPGVLRAVATVQESHSGRRLDVSTTEPGVQFYTGNFLDGSLRGKGGRAYGRRSGFCLETQHYPDSPNQPSFPSTVLEPGGVYRSTTVYAFSTSA